MTKQDIRYALWTGGWDSTFMLIYLLKKGYTVQPIYIIDENRLSLKQEDIAMNKIRKAMKKHRFWGGTLLPTQTYSISEIPPNKTITRAWQSIHDDTKLGSQHEWLARFAEYKNLDLYLGHEKGTSPNGHMTRTLKTYTVLKKTPEGFLIVDPEKSTQKGSIVLGKMIFPIMDFTEKDMLDKVKEWKVEDVMQHIWFCHNPTSDGKPCGKCHPCTVKFDSGLSFLLPGKLPELSQKLCVYTCITGEYDDLHEIKNPEPNIDYLCFTNNKKLKSKTWRIIQIQDKNLDNHHLSRKIKILGHPIISKNYNISIWMDASVVWKKNIRDFAKTYLEKNHLAAFKHHLRTSVKQEAVACLELRKDSKEKITSTLNYLKSEHFPDNIGLFEMTVFIKEHNDPQVIETMKLWFDMINKYSRRDQLSFVYATWKTKLKIDPIDLNVWDNPWFDTIKHNPNQVIKDCHIYYGNPNHNFDFNKYHIYDYENNKGKYQFTIKIPNDTNRIEISPSNVIGSCYTNLTITPHPDKLEHVGIITVDQAKIFCTERSLIVAHGNFKKDQQLSISIDLQIAPPSTINSLIELQWQNNNILTQQNTELQKQLTAFQDDNLKLKTTINDITNSRSWRAIRKIRQLIPLK